jgi:hypothetical protein
MSVLVDPTPESKLDGAAAIAIPLEAKWQSVLNVTVSWCGLPLRKKAWTY